MVLGSEEETKRRESQFTSKN